MTKIGPATTSTARTENSASTTSSDSETEPFEENANEQHNGERQQQFNQQNDTDLRRLIIAAEKVWQQIKQIFNYIMIELGGYQAFDKIAQWCVHNPRTALCLFAGSITFMLPFLIILGFGISTILMTFTGFLVLEGTLLTIVSMLIFGCFCVVGIVLLFTVLIFVAIYFGFTQIYDLYGGVNRHKTALLQFLQNERISRRASWNQPQHG